MDDRESQADLMRAGVHPEARMAEVDDEEDDDLAPTEPTASDEQAQRQQRRLDLEERLEIARMEDELDALRRKRDAGRTQAGILLGADEEEDRASHTASVASQHRRAGVTPSRSNRVRLREPDTFKGKTLKEAREFIRSLELVFALSGDAYDDNREKVLYGVMFLAGEPREAWHHAHSVSQLEGYTWSNFQDFVLDSVEDPANRSLTVTLAYEDAKQGDNQTAQAFASALTTLEEQMSPYTEEQRTRHLLAKLKPALRTAIVTYHALPTKREDLVVLATRLEAAGKRDGLAALPRSAGGSQANRNKGKKRGRSRSRSPAQKDRGPKGVGGYSAAGDSHRPRPRNDQKSDACYLCSKIGHWARDCPDKGKDSTVRKVDAVDPPSKRGKKAEPAKEPLPKIRLIREESRRNGVDSWPAKKLQGAVVSQAGSTTATMVLDDAADINVLSQAYAVRHDLRPISGIPLPSIEAFRGERGFCYGAYRIRIRLADSTGVERESEDIFFAVDMESPDLLLGRPWRRHNGIIVDSRDDHWWYSEAGEVPAARVREPGDFLKDLKKSSRIMVIRVRDDGSLEGLPKELADFADVFASAAEADAPPVAGAAHAIDLEPGKKPPFRPLYNLSVKELEALREYLEMALKNGWIRRSTSEAGAPIILVPKKDGSLRLCVDYRGLNEITIKNRHPLPLISETLDRLGRAACFSKLDLKDAYHRIGIQRGDEWKTAFRTRYGHFEYLVMPFGLTNAPATFQAYINRALAGLVDEFCVVYLDDILIYSDSREEHVRHVREVLARLRKFALYASLKKCEFFTTQVEFLGYVVSIAGVSMDPRRVSTIEEWPRPKTFREVQVFLGFANFYRRFIRSYSKIIAPLTSLMKGAKNGKKTGELVWNAAEEQAFRMVKAAFISAPILRHYIPGAPIRLETDASSFAIAAIVSQLLPAGDSPAEWRPIAFWSRKLNPAEQRYETHDGELLAIVEGFKQFRHYCEGASQAIQVLTDHNNLRGFMGVKQLNGRQARWATFLAAFDFNIEHRSGKSNPADGPSRRPDYEGGPPATRHLLPTLQAKLAVLEDNPATTAVVGRVRISSSTQEPLMRGFSVPQGSYRGPKAMIRAVVNALMREEDAFSPRSNGLAAALKKLQAEDTRLDALRKSASDAGEETAWIQDGDLWYYKDALYVPDDGAVRAQLMRIHHDDDLAGHFGGDKTEALLRRKYWWPTLAKDCRDYVRTCPICQVMKARRHRPYGDAQALPMPRRPWEEITMDFITDLPPSKWFAGVADAILVIVDRYSKMVIFVPTTKRCTSVELADILMEYVVRRYGVPRGSVTDRGSVFTSQYWSDFAYEAQVRHRLSTAFHPQTDGQTERMNQTLEQYLRCYCSEVQDEWASRLPQAEFAVNNGVHQALRMSPFEVLYGWNPEIRNGPTRDESSEGRVPAAEERARSMRETHHVLEERWRHATEAQVKSQNTRQKPQEFKVGDMVLLATKNLRLPVPKKKMAARYVGPFQVRDAIGKQAYRLALPTSYKIHNVFHVSLLEPWNQREGEEPADPMPLAEEDGEWEVEAILEHKRQAGKLYYLVQWKGWPDEYTQWEPAEACENAQEAIAAYEAQARSTRGRRKRK